MKNLNRETERNAKKCEPDRKKRKDPAVERAKAAERLVKEAGGFLLRRNKLFARYIPAERNQELDRHQIDQLQETVGSVSVGLQVKSTNNAVAEHYGHSRNKHILAFNPFMWGEDITAEEFSYILEKLCLTALQNPFEKPYEWFYLKIEKWRDMKFNEEAPRS